MFELTTRDSEKLELTKTNWPKELQDLADLQLVMIGGGTGAASLD